MTSGFTHDCKSRLKICSLREISQQDQPAPYDGQTFSPHLLRRGKSPDVIAMFRSALKCIFGIGSFAPSQSSHHPIMAKPIVIFSHESSQDVFKRHIQTQIVTNGFQTSHSVLPWQPRNMSRLV
jgi:hypothetical protein